MALFGTNDDHHKSAVSIFTNLKNSKALLYTSDYVIDETLTVTQVRGNHTQSVIAGKALFESDIIKIVYVAPDYLDDSWQLYQKYKDKHFSFTDVSSLVISKTLNIKKIFGFDKEFEKVGMELLAP